jgi:hydroxymethylpyrimidine/phosphomethylpyrimidine kinase
LAEPESSAPSIPIALTIAGSDSGGGAGIQADLKTFAALGVYGLSAITALTAQNTREVRGVLAVSPEFVGQQIDSVVEDMWPLATKTGMLGDAAIVEMVAAKVAQHGLAPLVVDPVLASTTGASLLSSDALSVLVRQLLPLATVVTPNLAEAEALTGRPVRTIDDMREAARRIQAMGPRSVVVTGGHLEDGADAIDVLLDGSAVVELRGPRLASPNTHGTGCTFASAIAAGLARGSSVATAVANAKAFVADAIQYGLPIGHGHGPVNQLSSFYARVPTNGCE